MTTTTTTTTTNPSDAVLAQRIREALATLSAAIDVARAHGLTVRLYSVHNYITVTDVVLEVSRSL